MAEVNGKDVNFTTVKLRKSVIANGDETMELVFREPTAGDIERYGNPVLLDMGLDPPRISFDSKSMTQMMATLASRYSLQAVQSSSAQRIGTLARGNWRVFFYRTCDRRADLRLLSPGQALRPRSG